MSEPIKVEVDHYLGRVLVIEIGDPDKGGRVILLDRDEAMSLLEQLQAHIGEMGVKI